MLLGLFNSYPQYSIPAALILIYFIWKHFSINYEATNEEIKKNNPLALVKDKRHLKFNYEEIKEVKIITSSPGNSETIYVCKVKLNSNKRIRLEFDYNENTVYEVINLLLKNRIVVQCNSNIMDKYISIFSNEKDCKYLKQLYN
jgi:hypothetical protein